MTQQKDSKAARLKEQGVLNPHPERVSAPDFQCDTFFDPQDIVQVKYEMLRLVEHDGLSKVEAAERFGFSRPTFYQAQADFDRQGLEGLLPRQRGPKGAHKLDEAVMAFVDRHVEDSGPMRVRKLAQLIEAEFQIQVHPRSIERALRRKKNCPQNANDQPAGNRGRTLRVSALSPACRHTPFRTCRTVLSRHDLRPELARREYLGNNSTKR